MAKISTYPHAASPQLSDMLIGSEVGDGNATKNFLISDIIGLIDFGAYVPYTGATEDVDITGYDFYADHVYADITANVVKINSDLIDGLGNSGTNGQVLTTNGSQIVWSTFGLQQVLNRGNTATANINLTGNIFCDQINVDTVTTQNIWLTARFYDSAFNPGTVNQVLRSQGATVSWGDCGLQEVLDAGNTAISDISLQGDFTITGGGSSTVPHQIVTGIFEQTGDTFTSSFAGKVQMNKELVVGDKLIDAWNSPGDPGQILSSDGSVVKWIDAYSPMYGSFYDNSTQLCTPGSPIAIKIGTTVISSGVSVVNDGTGNFTYIRVDSDGVYNVQFSAQMGRLTGGASQKADIWLRLNGSDIAWSNTQLTFQSIAAYQVAAWNFFVELAEGDDLQIMWHQSGGDIQILAQAAQAFPTRPATPSVILTVNKIS